MLAVTSCLQNPGGGPSRTCSPAVSRRDDKKRNFLNEGTSQQADYVFRVNVRSNNQAVVPIRRSTLSKTRRLFTSEFLLRRENGPLSIAGLRNGTPLGELWPIIFVIRIIKSRAVPNNRRRTNGDIIYDRFVRTCQRRTLLAFSVLPARVCLPFSSFFFFFFSFFSRQDSVTAILLPR